jgi:ubiquinone/menaquinone biosynthesis C-methylase UbiE
MIFEPAEPTEIEVKESRLKLISQRDLYRKHGFDRERAISFVIDNAGALREPVLDIGTGKGMAAIEIARRGIPVTSVDISEEELRLAFLNARAENVDSSIAFHVGDANGLPFEDAHFQLVTMINVLHHVEDFSGIFKEVSRVLAPGGRFLIADLTEEGFEILDRIHSSEGREHPRLNGYEMDEVADMLPSFGLECKGRDVRFQEYVIVADKV